MIPFIDTTGLAGCAVAMAAAALVLPGVPRLPRPYRMALAGAVIIVALIPFGGLPLAAYVRGVIGDLSIVTLMLLVLSLASRLSDWRPFDSAGRRALLSWVVLAAMGLYPLALGIGYFDPYRLGYGDPWFLGALLALALAAWWRRLPLPALAIALAVSAWGMGWYGSSNLWDYLLDPLAAIYALGALARRGAQTLLGRRSGRIGKMV